MFNSLERVSVGDRVRPDSVVAVTRLPLPRLFFLSAFRALPGGSLEGYIAEWKIKQGDRVGFDDEIAVFTRIEEPEGEVIAPGGVSYDDPREKILFRSPLDGTIEHMIPETGLVMLREEIDYSRRTALVQVGQRIGLWGRKLKRYVKREKGDFVEKGQILAQRIDAGDESSPGGFRFARAPIAGVITEIDFGSGLIKLKRDFRDVELKAGFFGRVSAIDETMVEITAMGRRIPCVCGIGREAFGRLRVAVPDGRARLEAGHLDPGDGGAIIVGGASVSPEALERAKELEIAALVTGGADHLDLCDLLGEDFAVSVTGKEKAPFPVIITGEFGESPMDEGLFGFFSEQRGRWAHVSPTTHMRAGVVRPEIVVMSEDS